MTGCSGPNDRRRYLTSVRTRAVRMAALLMAFGAAASSACAPGEPAGTELRRVPGEPSRTSTSLRIAATTTEPTAPSSEVAAGTAPATTDPATYAAATDAALRDLVDGVLAEYAAALTAIAADPVAAPLPGTATRLAWDLTVVPGSWLSRDVLRGIERRHDEDRMVVVPPGHGPSYRHRPLRVGPPTDGSISFTWCGWSPGVGLDVDTREVVDDGVAHAHGTGSIRAIGGRWMLESLDELDLTVLPAGSPDPCLGEVEALEQQR